MVKYNYSDVKDWNYNLSNINKVMYNGNEVYRKYTTDEIHPQIHNYLAFVAIEDGTFTFSGTSRDEIHNSVSYSLDGGETWVALENGSNTPTVHAGEVIMWKGTNTPVRPITTGATEENVGIGEFKSTSKFNVEGNSLSLLFGDRFDEVTPVEFIAYDYAFDKLLRGCNKLVDASGMIIAGTILPTRCYTHMFWHCTSLTKAPVLPSTMLTMNCYLGMFKGCTSLVIPPRLNATTLAAGCYAEMFEGCTSLRNAPELPASVLAKDCYDSMFKGCTRLNNVTCLAIDKSAQTPTSGWLINVASSGVFRKPRGVEWERNNNGIPSGWTVVNI